MTLCIAPIWSQSSFYPGVLSDNPPADPKIQGSEKSQSSFYPGVLSDHNTQFADDDFVGVSQSSFYPGVLSDGTDHLTSPAALYMSQSSFYPGVLSDVFVIEQAPTTRNRLNPVSILGFFLMATPRERKKN